MTTGLHRTETVVTSPSSGRASSYWRYPKYPLKLSDMGFVYIIGAPGRPLKVGRAVDVQSRLKAIQTGNPDRLRILATVGVMESRAPEVERTAHQVLAEHRVTGEWFRAPVDVAEGAVRRAAEGIWGYRSTPTEEIARVGKRYALPPSAVEDAETFSRWLDDPERRSCSEVVETALRGKAAPSGYWLTINALKHGYSLEYLPFDDPEQRNVLSLAFVRGLWTISRMLEMFRDTGAPEEAA